MNLLLDTHVALWWFADPSSLSAPASSAISDLQNGVYVSSIVAWEIAIKRSLGKLEAPVDLKGAISANFFETIDVTLDDALRVESLPWHHRDPFDRLLIAQAIGRDWTIVTRDGQFEKYGVALIQG
ncbi:type II toxin-antitoxin system VapC family toxin [Aeoliella sp. SH292]|uniref:type II toxin-antitoxin system VapC family toxin n=1 Tax=Aeoliella sp. SH292 TaxID=3454464 RepID=UPI003F970A20